MLRRELAESFLMRMSASGKREAGLHELSVPEAAVLKFRIIPECTCAPAAK